jgi:hypothetical protein
VLLFAGLDHHHCTLGKPNANRNHLLAASLAAAAATCCRVHLRCLGQSERRCGSKLTNQVPLWAQNEEQAEGKTNDFYFGNQSEEEEGGCCCCLWRRRRRLREARVALDEMKLCLRGCPNRQKPGLLSE